MRASGSTGRRTQAVVGVHFSWPTEDTNKVGGAASLALNAGNQSDTWIQITNAADLQFGTNDFTVSFWFKKLHGTGSFSDTFGVGKWRSGGFPGQNEWALALALGANDNKPSFAIEAGTVIYSTASPSNITLNAWHHLVAVRRQTALELYVDRVLMSHTTGIPAGAAVNKVAGRLLYIGAAAQPGALYANALYDDFQIYAYAVGNGGAAVGQTAGGEIAYLYAHPGLEATGVPGIVTQPLNQAVLAGSAAAFSVIATNPSLSYQWRLNTTNLIAWGTTATLTITNVAARDLGFYDVIVTNSFGSVQSARAKLGFPQLGIEGLPGNAIQVVVEGGVGVSTRIDWSTNLTGWDTLTNFTLPSNPFKLVDSSIPWQPTRYYRAVFQY